MLARVGKAIVVLASLYCLLFQGIGDVGMLSADEPRYAAIGREMALSGDWITPHLWGAAWFEKPPLLYWMIATAWKLGLQDEWAARLPVAFTTLAFLAFLYQWMKRNFDADAAARASIMLATTVGWIGLTSVAVTDIPMSAAFGVAALLAAPNGSDKRRERISPWAGAFLGLAILAKSLVPVVMALPILWFWRDRWRALVVPAATALAVAAPWYIACYAINGKPFFDELIIRQQIGRFFTPERQHVQPIWFYIPVLLGLLAPWTPALAALRRTPRINYFLAIAAFGFLFLSLSTNKLPGYLLPLFPVLCIALAVNPLSKRILYSCAALAATIPLAARMLPEAMETGLGHASLPGSPAIALIALAITAMISVTIVALAEQRWHRGIYAVAVLAAAFVGYSKYTIYPELDRTVSARQDWLRIAAHPDQVCIEGKPRDLEYGLAYYNRKPLPDCFYDNRPIHLHR